MVLTKENVSLAFVIGAPGSGRATQAAKIAEAFGNRFLDGLKDVTPEVFSAGEVVGLLKKEIELSQSHKFLIRGFPQDVEHGRAFDEIVGVDPDFILFLDCPERELVSRLLNRKERPLTANLETARSLLRYFNANKLPVMNYYSQKGVKLHEIDGAGTIDEVFERVCPIFAAFEEDRNSN